MDRTERFYKIDQMIHDLGVVTFRQLQEALEVSRATLKRDLEYMRSRFNAPIVWDRDRGGYRFEQPDTDHGPSYALPGLWFNASEAHALLTMQQLLANIDPGGLLAPHVRPLLARLNAMLGSAETVAEEVRRRVMIVGLARRRMQPQHFERVGSALLRRQRLRIRYFARGSGQSSEREVSPQRLVYYRENWYLDAWCHWRQDLRHFSVDAIEHAEILPQRAKEISRRAVDTALGPGYGIFSEGSLTWATLRFSPLRARWVAQETWHPSQRSRFCVDGSYELEIPYVDDRELLMDILKFGADVEVLGPEPLRLRIANEAANLLKQYRPLEAGI